MTEQQLKNVLQKHKLWFEDCSQQDAERADLHSENLCNANLRGVDLSYADLYCADLHSANLRDANLHGANLYGADLSYADLHGANLYNANLRGVSLRGADLSYANLRGANLYNADLRDADLSYANLLCTNLSYANLHNANLYGAELHGANLYDANLSCAKNVPFIPYVCPDCGSFIGDKKVQGLIVELEILSDAKRTSATNRKCRCNKAKVLSIQNLDGTKSDLISVASDRDATFIYKVGETVVVDDFDENRWNECSTGIHFFINRQEAVDYDN